MDLAGNRKQLALDMAWEDAKERSGRISRQQFDAALEAVGWAELVAAAGEAVDMAERLMYAQADYASLPADLDAIIRLRTVVYRAGGGK